MDSRVAPVRGAVNNESQATQLRDFTGLQYGKITPTDIDAFIEYRDKCYVIIEAKYGKDSIPFGQNLALERLCDDLEKIKPTILIVAVHETETGNAIDFSKCEAAKIRRKGTWFPKPENKNMTVRQAVDMFFKKYG